VMAELYYIIDNLITLGTHTTGNYVATIADSGTGGITVANSGAESAAVTLEMDVHSLTTAAIASGDFIAFSDEGESGDPSRKETIDDIATLFSGDGLTSSSAVMSLDLKSNGGAVIESNKLAIDLAASSITGTLAVGDGGTGTTSLDNLITLGTHTTGNYVATIADSGTGGITVANSGAESAAVTLEMDVHSLTTAAIASGDFIAFSDEGESGDPSRKETIDDIATLFSGDGLTSSSAVMSLDLKSNGGAVIESNKLAIDLAASSITGTLAVGDGGTGTTSLDNLITLGTHTTGNYVATIADSGTGGITVANSGAESAAVTLEMDVHGLTTAAIASGDFIAFSDEGESGDPSRKETIDDIATLFSGDGLTSSSAVMSLDLKSNGGAVIESNKLAIDLAASSITGTLAVGDGGTGTTSLDNLITLGTHTTGNYVATIADSGTGGITVANSGAESASVTLEMDVHGLTTAAIASGDFIAFSDEGESGDPSRKETIDDIATLFSGDGLTSSSAVMSLD